jgi:hypothetical protein
MDDVTAKYKELGIDENTWACIAVETLVDAKSFLFQLALEGEPALVAQDADNPKVYHIAVRGGLLKSPRAWLVGLRGADKPYQQCRFPTPKAQHPQEGRNG